MAVLLGPILCTHQEMFELFQDYLSLDLTRFGRENWWMDGDLLDFYPVADIDSFLNLLCMNLRCVHRLMPGKD